MKIKYIRALKCTLCLLLALLCLSCGEFSEAVGIITTTSQLAQGDSPSSDEESKFTVKLIYEGAPFVPESETYAHWTDGFSFYNAKINEKGEASVKGLDGDFRVTLSQIPEGYSYNPNIYKATNKQKDVVIELYKLKPTKGEGEEPYQSIPIDETGMYQATITNEDDIVYYEFNPKTNGVYSVVSWVDTVENNINPMCDVYNGTVAFKVYSRTIDDGGDCAQFTKNFRHEVKITDDEIGNVFTFGVKATSKDGKYPIKVNFAVQLDGGFKRNEVNATWIVPKEKFKQTPEYDKSIYKFVGCETLDRGNYIFDASLYGLNEDDGYYHVYNEQSGKFDGPILYAYISSATRFIEKSFTTIEDDGNKALTVSNGTENYKLFIEGFYSVARKGYFCTTDCVGCHSPGEACAEVGKACTVSMNCQKCTQNCRPCPDNAYGSSGYASFTNSDGVYAVTPELKEFLEKFSASQFLFFDGNGWVETNPSIKVDAKEDAEWLFACGYYVKK